MSKIPEYVLVLVSEYILARKYNVKQTMFFKNEVDLHIKKLNLNKKEVYFYFGDPDNPATKTETLNKIEEFRKNVM